MNDTLFEAMMKYLRIQAESDLTTGDHHTREAAKDFICAYDLWKNPPPDPFVADQDYYLFDPKDE